MSACSGAWGSPRGAGMRRTISSSSSGTPSPVLALTSAASCASMPMISSISFLTRSASAEARSILLMTGSTVRPCSTAVWQFATLCASTPWEASTTSSAPSQAARLRDTS